MSAINTNINQQGYYNLGSSGGSGAGSGAGTQQANRSGATQLAPSRNLAQSGSLAGSAAYMLDLSPEAQQYLRGLQQQPAPTVRQPAVSEDGFTLNSQQRLALASLLERFKDEPYTQETFDAIQDELDAQGIGPTQLAARYRATSFNPTASLVDALNGGNGTTPGAAPVGDAELQERSGQYMQFVISEWKKLATPADDGEGAQSGPAIAAVEGGAGA